MKLFYRGAQGLLACALIIGSGGAALAQLKPWPTDPQQSAPTKPWPGDPQPSAPAATPMPPQAQPTGVAPGMTMSPMMGVPLGGGPGPGLGGGPPPEVQQCLSQFMKLREEAENRGKVAKAGNDKHVSREEMCKLITDLVGAEGRWVKYASDNAAKCGIPGQIVGQLKENHSKTLGFKKMACATGPAGGGGAPPAPTLSDALGTARLPTPDASGRGGTLDTLSGNPIR
jgi:hypothetical protein